MGKKTLAVTGLSGVIGSVLLRRIKIPNHLIVDMYHDHPYAGASQVREHIPLNLLHKESIIAALNKAKPDTILHLAAITHIDTCEGDKKNGKEGIVWRINVEGTRAIAQYGKQNNIPVIYLSTECVFDGTLDFYNEHAKKNPINWYGRTKSEAEDFILSSAPENTVIRAAIAYHKKDSGKTLLGKIYHSLKNTTRTYAVTDQFITPAYSHDIARTIAHHVTHGSAGIFHVSPNRATTPYHFARLVAQSYGYRTSRIQRVSLSELYGPERAAIRLRRACLWAESAEIPAKTPEEVLKTNNRDDRKKHRPYDR